MKLTKSKTDTMRELNGRFVTYKGNNYLVEDNMCMTNIDNMKHRNPFNPDIFDDNSFRVLSNEEVLKLNKFNFEEDWNKKLSHMTQEELKDTVKIMHSWVKQHQMALTQANKIKNQAKEHLEIQKENNQKLAEQLSLNKNARHNEERMRIYYVNKCVDLLKSKE